MAAWETLDERGAGLVADEAAGGPLFDPESGLASDSLIRFVVGRRIVAARGRLDEVWVALVAARSGADDPCAAPVMIGELLGDALVKADAVGRLADGRYLVLFDGRREREVLAATTALRSAVSERCPSTVLHAGLASYPRHGSDLDELLVAAGAALDSAAQWPIHRVEVAHLG